MILTLVISALPICLPPPDLDFRGKQTVAMGWGMYENWAFLNNKERKKRNYDTQSKILKYVILKVSNRRLHKNFFGTEVNKTSWNPISLATAKQCNEENYKKLRQNPKQTLETALGRCKEDLKDLCDETLKDIFKECEKIVIDVCSGDSGVCVVHEYYSDSIIFYQRIVSLNDHHFAAL